MGHLQILLTRKPTKRCERDDQIDGEREKSNWSSAIRILQLLPPSFCVPPEVFSEFVRGVCGRDQICYTVCSIMPSNTKLGDEPN
jgi:hypothetical protein